MSSKSDAPPARPRCVFRAHEDAPPQKVDRKLLALVRDLRARAQEVLAKAETMTDADAQERMRAVAVSYEYEKLAERVEEQTADEA